MLQNNSQIEFRIILGVILMNLLVFGLSGYSLFASRVHYDEQARIETGNLTSALEHNIRGILDKIDLALWNEKTEAERQLAKGSIDRVSFDSHLANTLDKIPEMGEIRMAVANGDIIYGLGPGVKNIANVADRDYFIALRNNPGAGLFISKPLLGRISKKWHINLARRVNNPDGSFAGVIHGNLQISQLQKQFASYDLGKNGIITLRRNDLSIVVRYPETEKSTPGNVSITNELSQIINEGKTSGSYKTTSKVDGIHRVFSFRKVSNYPLYVNCGFATNDYLRAWYLEIYKQLALVLLFVFVTLASTRYLLKSWKEKQAAFDELNAARNELEQRVAERTVDLKNMNDNLIIQSTQLQKEISVRQTAEEEITAKNRQLEQEINIRMQAEKELQASERRFSQLIHNSFDTIVILDANGIQRYVSPSSERSHGYTPAELVDISVIEQMIHPDDKELVQAAFRQIIETGSGGAQYRHRRKAGGWVHLEAYGTNQLDNPDINGVVINVRDITDRFEAEEERIALEKQLLHAQKMESLGVLAGGIAHDFNNILTSIVGNTELALMRLNPESPVLENLQRIEKGAMRATDLAKQMLAYSGKGKFVVEAIDLNRLVEEMGHMLDVSISKKAVLRYNLTKPLPSIEADATQIRQVVMNLVINASDAISDKSGVIAITTGCIQCDRNYLRAAYLNNDIPEGLYVYLEVADTGCGMDKETQSKLFDPFFTTKFTGRGLGMAAVQGIVRGHKGAINVYSEVGKGSSFKLLFPAGMKPAEQFDRESKKIGFKGGGTILLVDDEETIRAIGTEMLKELGFTVITANDGKEAVDLYKTHQGLHCVILDLTMPHMDGEQTFRELRMIDPNVHVIMASGYSEYEVTQKFAGKGLSGFIQKPFKMSALQDVLQHI